MSAYTSKSEMVLWVVFSAIILTATAASLLAHSV